MPTDTGALTVHAWRGRCASSACGGGQAADAAETVALPFFTKPLEASDLVFDRLKPRLASGPRRVIPLILVCEHAFALGGGAQL